MASELTSGLAYREGNLYVTVGRGLISVELSDGAETLLSPARASALWVEGDQLLLNGGTYGTQLFSLPLTGGTPTLVADGTEGRAEPGIGHLGTFLPTATDFFFAESSWVSSTDPITTVWRVPRAAGPPVEIARFTELDAAGDRPLYFQSVALAPEGVVLGGNWGVGKVVPLDGGSPRTLPVPDADNVIAYIDFVGVDARGVYSSVRKQHAGVGPSELVVAPADGGAVRPVWSSLPAFSYVAHAWPDGAGGLVVVGGQRFRDEDEDEGRATVWSIDANGNARRLACSPNGSYVANRPPAVAPDAFYFVALLGNQQMQFIRVPRVAP